MKKLITLALIATLLVGCSKRDAEEKKTEPPQQAQAVVVAEAPTTQESIIAVLRGHPNSIQVCHEPNFTGYLLDYGPLLPPGKEDDNLMHGWFLIQDVKFYKSANNTWFIGDQKNEAYIRVYPDTTGLTCKQH